MPDELRREAHGFLIVSRPVPAPPPISHSREERLRRKRELQAKSGRPEPTPDPDAPISDGWLHDIHAPLESGGFAETPVQTGIVNYGLALQMIRAAITAATDGEASTLPTKPPKKTGSAPKA